MKKLNWALLALSVLSLGAGLFFGLRSLSRPTAGRASEGEARAASVETSRATPADVRIAAGQSKIDLAPDKPDGYNLLAAAYMQKARETGDFSFNAKADAALDRALQLQPGNYDALKLRAKILLTHHRFADALAYAERARNERPEDHDVYGALVDANVELGNYDRAVEAAQRMVDLRPDASAYARISYLRELHGDTQGAAEAMEVAVKASDPRDPEAVAWARVHLGNELRRLGKLAESERQYDMALATFPNYRAALVAKAHARAAEGNYEEAIRIYLQDDSHDRHLALGDLYTKSGRDEEARREYEAFEAAERSIASEENDYSHLARFWADRDANLDEALDIMQRERERRADIHTCDALAWVLYKKGMLNEAERAINEALRTKTREPLINYHAGMIYRALGNNARAARHLKLALEADAAFDLLQSDVARRTLASLKG